jgi:hypothetical protein
MQRRNRLAPLAGSAAAVVLVTAAISLLRDSVPVLSLGSLYVLAVLPVAILWGRFWAVLVAIASMLAFNFFFLEPVHTFRLSDRSNWLALAVYLATAIAVSELAARARQRAAEAERKAAEAGPVPEPKRNITDPDSRLMPVRGGGFIQGFNAQAVRSADGLCLAAMVTAGATDYASYQPMITRAQAASTLLRAAGRGPLHRRRARIGLVLADAGYCSQANLTCPGPDRLIATGKRRNLEKAARHDDPAASPSPAIAAMAARLATPQGITAYRQRGPIAEAHFGNIKHNHGFTRFHLRGLPRVNGEWTFQNTITNLLKIHATGWSPATA